MASRQMLTIVSALAALLIRLAFATNHTIGGPSGWTMAADVQTWAASQTFLVGDNLVFSYPSAFHDVVEVSKPDFDNCQAVKPLATFSNGNTIVPLTSPGRRYFICGTPGHCKQGMKLEVNVLPAANPAPEASPQPPISSLPNAGINPLAPIAPPPSTLPSGVSPQPLLPLNPGVVPVLSPSSTPLPKVSSLPLNPAVSPDASPAATSLPLLPGSASSGSGSSKTVGNFPSGTTATTSGLDSSESAPVDSSAASKSLVLGFGFVLMMIILLF